MSKRAKLIQKMRTSPGNVRFGEVDAFLRHLGFDLFNQRGSHCTYYGVLGQLITVVRPHGNRKTCHPADIRKLLELLEL